MINEHLRPHLTDEDIQNRLQSRDMIRGRSIDSYALLGVDIGNLAVQKVQEKGSFVWYDMCCGDFHAAGGLIDNLHWGTPEEKAIIPQLKLNGIDLDTVFPGRDEMRGRTIERANVATYDLPSTVDLVTSFRGLCYVEEYMGLGLETIERWYNAMPIGATMAVDLFGNKRLEDPTIHSYLNTRFRENTVRINGDYILGTDALALKIVKPNAAPLSIPK